MNNPNSTEKIIKAFREKCNLSIGKGGFLTMTPPYCISGKEVEQFLTKSLNDVAERAREEFYKEHLQIFKGRDIQCSQINDDGKQKYQCNYDMTPTRTFIAYGANEIQAKFELAKKMKMAGLNSLKSKPEGGKE